MTEDHNLKIQTIPVTIKVVEVGGKKMTVSVFNQIPEKDVAIFVECNEFDMNNYLGWVFYKDEKYILFTENAILYKFKPILHIPNGVMKEYLEMKNSFSKKANFWTGEQRKAIKDNYDDFHEEMILHNNLFKDMLKYEYQLYISI